MAEIKILELVYTDDTALLASNENKLNENMRSIKIA